ncbi:MAG: hypothetical protein ACR2JH_03580 [Solirubrobacteraceae bacterium]
MRVLRSVARLRRLASLLAGALTLALGLAACGDKVSHPTVADNEGVYVDAGAVSYQVQVSRQLNPYNSEDRQYLNGVDSPPPKPDQEWFAVFLYAKNETHSNQTTTDSFDITDTQGNQYFPVAVNPSVNPYAWTAQTLQPLGTEPAPDTTAAFGPTQGALLLFKLDVSVYSSRPLTLEINSSDQAQPAVVSLDL